jgi:hypothetical protein
VHREGKWGRGSILPLCEVVQILIRHWVIVVSNISVRVSGRVAMSCACHDIVKEAEVYQCNRTNKMHYLLSVYYD